MEFRNPAFIDGAAGMYQHGRRESAAIVSGPTGCSGRRGEAIARLVSAAPAAGKRSLALAQRQRVANVFDHLKRLRADTTLDMPLRQAIELGRD